MIALRKPGGALGSQVRLVQLPAASVGVGGSSVGSSGPS